LPEDCFTLKNIALKQPDYCPFVATFGGKSGDTGELKWMF
jgi:hypothetical protein